MSRLLGEVSPESKWLPTVLQDLTQSHTWAESLDMPKVGTLARNTSELNTRLWERNVPVADQGNHTVNRT